MAKIREMLAAELDEKGREVVSSVPMAPPVGYKKEPSVTDRLRAMVRSELLRREVEAQGGETFDEADDFDIPDDPVDPSTPYEENFDPVRPPLKPAEAPPVGGPPVTSPAPSPTPAAAPAAVPTPKP